MTVESTPESPRTFGVLGFDAFDQRNLPIVYGYALRLVRWPGRSSAGPRSGGMGRFRRRNTRRSVPTPLDVRWLIRVARNRYVDQWRRARSAREQARPGLEHLPRGRLRRVRHAPTSGRPAERARRRPPRRARVALHRRAAGRRDRTRDLPYDHRHLLAARPSPFGVAAQNRRSGHGRHAMSEQRLALYDDLARRTRSLVRTRPASTSRRPRA